MGSIKPNAPILARLGDYALTRLFIACNRFLDYCHLEAPRHPKHADLWDRRIQDAQSAVKFVGSEIARREQGEPIKRTRRPAKVA